MTETLFETTKTKDEELYCVYCHRNKINGKRYIGQTKQVPEERFGKNGSNYSRCVHFNNAINKYGWDSFEHYVIQDNLTKEEADELEQVNIAFYRTNDNKFGYNLQSGGGNYSYPCSERRKEMLKTTFTNRKYVHKGEITKFIPEYEVNSYIAQGYELGRYLSEESRKKMGMGDGKHKPHSEETKQKLREINLGKHMSEEAKKKISRAQLGKHLSEEHKRHISESEKGKIVSEETKRKLSIAMTGKHKSNGRLGTHLSEETKQKISKTLKSGRYADKQETNYE